MMYEGEPGVSPEEAARGVLRSFEALYRQVGPPFEITGMIAVFGEAALSALGYRLEVLTHLWRALQKRETPLTVLFDEAFEGDAEAMSRLTSTTEYLRIPCEHVRPYDVWQAEVAEHNRAVINQYREEIEAFLERCSVRTFELDPAAIRATEHPELN